jgi:cell division protein FtsW
VSRHDYEPLPSDDFGADPAWDAVQPILDSGSGEWELYADTGEFDATGGNGITESGQFPQAGLTMSGAVGGLAFDLSHPRRTPGAGVPALEEVLNDASPSIRLARPESERAHHHPQRPSWFARAWHAVRDAVWRACGLDRSARVIAWLVVASMGLGLVMIYSTSAISAERDPRLGDALFFLRRQTWAVGFGLIAMAVLAHLSMRRWRWLARVSVWLAVISLLLVLVPGIGYAANGARRWVRIFGFGFQPSDFARVGMVCWLAHCAALRAEGDRLVHWKAFGALGAIVGLIVIEPDVGTAATTAGVGVLLLWLGGTSWKKLALIALVCGPIVGGAAYAKFPHVRKRIATFVGARDGEAQKAGSHQLTMSQRALGVGHFFGVGVGNGKLKLNYLPEESTDFILAEVGEELGLAGTGTVVFLLAALCLHGCVVALRCRHPFGAVLAAGSTILITTQGAANIAVVTGLMPTTGIALPFISFGRSGTLALACAAGALIAVARWVEQGDAETLAWPEPLETENATELETCVDDEPTAPAAAAAEETGEFALDERPMDFGPADPVDPWGGELPPLDGPAQPETIMAPDLLAEICSDPLDAGFELDDHDDDDSEPAIELDRELLIREDEFRWMRDAGAPERSTATPPRIEAPSESWIDQTPWLRGDTP